MSLQAIENHRVLAHTRSIQKQFPRLFSSKIHVVLSYIDANEPRNIQIGELARIVGLESIALRRKFRVEVGISFDRYIFLRKIQQAMALLQDQNISIQEISYLAGFDSPEAFARVFKRYARTSPKEYRRQFHEW